MIIAKEIPSSETVGDDILFYADIAGIRLFLVACDEHFRVAAAEIVYDAALSERKDVDDCLPCACFRGYEGSFAGKHPYQLEDDSADDEYEKKPDKEEGNEDAGDHDELVCRDTGNRTQTTRTFTLTPKVRSSECRESNPGHTHLHPAPIFVVGAPGIEPRPHAPEACVLPLYYAPKFGAGRGVRNTTIQHSDVFGVRAGVRTTTILCPEFQ